MLELPIAPNGRISAPNPCSLRRGLWNLFKRKLICPSATRTHKHIRAAFRLRNEKEKAHLNLPSPVQHTLFHKT